MNGYSNRSTKPASPNNTTRSRAAAAQQGFTLVEVLVAISIIAILTAFLLPAISGASRTAKITAVRVQFTSLEKAIADFATAYGEAPPSRVLLFETGAGWTTPITADITPLNASSAIPAAEAETLRGATLGKIGKFWRQFDFAANRDINNDGVTQAATSPLLLTGAECLTFFLGGMAVQDATDPTVVAYIGFSKNAANPFFAGTGSPVTLVSRDQSTRSGPFDEFKVSQLIDVDNDGMREYCDNLPNPICPILYLRAKNRRYNTADMVVFGDGARDLTAIYTQGASGPAWKEQSFQLISPGYDREYGTGGGYTAENGLVNPGSRANEVDNITNFSQLTLE
jgi:prepilin-type N-terminal cleavage/methylation domain-containing protein